MRPRSMFAITFSASGIVTFVLISAIEALAFTGTFDFRGSGRVEPTPPQPQIQQPR